MKKLYLVQFSGYNTYNTTFAENKKEAIENFKRDLGESLFNDIQSWHTGKKAEKLEKELNHFWSMEFN